MVCYPVVGSALSPLWLLRFALDVAVLWLRLSAWLCPLVVVSRSVCAVFVASCPLVCCCHQPPRNSPDAATNAMVMIYLDRLVIEFVGCVDPVVACVHVHGIQVTEVFHRVLVFRM